MDRSDGGGIVVGWLLKLTLVLLIIGVLVFELAAVAMSKVSAADDAQYIALGASEEMILHHATEAVALKAAQQRADSRGVVLGKKDVTFADNGSVQVHVRKTADTLFLQHIGPLAQFTVADETYTTPALR